MAENTQGASASSSVTALNPFFPCNPDRTPLFCVNPGVPHDDALAEASCFLAAVRNVIAGVATGCDEERTGTAESLYGAGYLVEMAKAAIDAVVLGSGDDTRREYALLLRLHQLCKEGVLIINPQADKPAADDAAHFLGWVEQQVKGGAV